MNNIRKHQLFFCILASLLILVGFVAVADAQQFIVRTVYFQPSDAPDPTREIFDLLTETQDFYLSEMERHGYGAKTFRLENAPDGNPGIHIFKGKHTTDHYLKGIFNTITAELPREFTTGIATNNAQLIIVGGLNHLDNGRKGYAWYYAQLAEGMAGGIAFVAGNALGFQIIAHEIGHTFGLYHTWVPGAIMGTGKDLINDYEARWLNRHQFFNEKRIRNDLPVVTEVLPIEALPKRGLRFKVITTSKNGLYHAKLYRHRSSFNLGSIEVEGKSATLEIDVRRADLINGDEVSFQIMDVHGNHIVHPLGSIILPPQIEPPEAVEEVVEDSVEDCCPPDEADLAVRPNHLLTTQWARLKLR